MSFRCAGKWLENHILHRVVPLMPHTPTWPHTQWSQCHWPRSPCCSPHLCDHSVATYLYCFIPSPLSPVPPKTLPSISCQSVLCASRVTVGGVTVGITAWVTGVVDTPTVSESPGSSGTTMVGGCGGWVRASPTSAMLPVSLGQRVLSEAIAVSLLLLLGSGERAAPSPLTLQQMCGGLTPTPSWLLCYLGPWAQPGNPVCGHRPCPSPVPPPQAF